LTVELIHGPLAQTNTAVTILRLPVERLTLAKRRWRGTSEDGQEFGFDLERPLGDGAAFFKTESALYVIAQKYEPVLEIALGTDAAAAARLGWIVGNLHFAIEVAESVVRVTDDPAIRQLCEREAIAFTACKRVFHPLGGGHSHGHSH
jgi:urease accessory protein